MSHNTRQFKNVYEVYTIDREEDNPKTTPYSPIKHNRNYKNQIIILTRPNYIKNQ